MSLFMPLPDDLAQLYADLSNQGLLAQRIGRPEEAVRQFSKLYSRLRDAQDAHTRYHKGGPLHNLGISYLLAGDNENALRNFLLAYVEDLLSKPEEEVYKADREAAAQALRLGYDFDEGVLLAAKEVVQEEKTQKRLILSPEAVLREALRNMKAGDDIGLLTFARRRPTVSGKRSIHGIGSPWHHRVFIGGEYGSIGVLNEVKRIVVARSFDGIIALEYEMPEDSIHHHTLMLLHTCRFAIFDVSRDGGHLMEIERLRDYGVTPLFLFSVPDIQVERQAEPRATAMLRTLGVKARPWRDVKELAEIINEFLPPLTG